MPPKAKVDRQMIVDAAFAIAREAGGDKISARAVARRLNCSTQPVMYHFKTIEELKKAAYREADGFHSEYLIRISGENPILGMGVNYIRFAVEEGNLFRFLFQSNEFSGKSISQLVSAEELQPVIGMLAEAEQLNVQDARTLFRLLFLFVHGYASMFMGNTLAYDEETIRMDLLRIYHGIVQSFREESK